MPIARQHLYCSVGNFSQTPIALHVARTFGIVAPVTRLMFNALFPAMANLNIHLLRLLARTPEGLSVVFEGEAHGLVPLVLAIALSAVCEADADWHCGVEFSALASTPFVWPAEINAPGFASIPNECSSGFIDGAVDFNHCMYLVLLR